MVLAVSVTFAVDMLGGKESNTAATPALQHPSTFAISPCLLELFLLPLGLMGSSVTLRWYSSGGRADRAGLDLSPF